MPETPIPEAATDETVKEISISEEYLMDKEVSIVAAIGDLRGLVYIPHGGKEVVRVILGRNVDRSAVIDQSFGDFSLGDIALLRTICDKILSDVYANQSFIPARPERSE